MAAIRRRDTNSELRVRTLVHAAGLRYRVDFPIRVDGCRPIRPDLVFTRARVAVFIDGCFWHGCPVHGSRTVAHNEHYWTPKIAGNAERDARHSVALSEAGWTVLRFWEHEDPVAVAREIARVYTTALPGERAEPVPQADDPALVE